MFLPIRIKCIFLILLLMPVIHSFGQVNKVHKVKPGISDSIHLNQVLPGSLKSDTARYVAHTKADLLNLDSMSHSWIKKLPKPTYQGRIALESYYTTFQNPRVLNEPKYLRIYGNASVNVLGIPLLVDGYRTTENQAFYNSNYFKVSFDYESYVEGIKKGWQEKYRQSASLLNSNQLKKQQDVKLHQALGNQKDDLQIQQSKMAVLLEQQTIAFEQKYRQRADSLLQNHRDSLGNTIASNRDSLTNWAAHQQERFKDSLALSRLEKDTQRIANHLRELNKKYSEYQSKKTCYDSLISADSAKLLYYKKLLDDPKGNASSWLKEKGFPKQLVFLSHLKDLQTGIINPYIHPYSISGIGMKGLTTIGASKSELQFTTGKAIISDMNYYNRTNSKYERLFVAASYKFQWNNNTELLIFGHHARDPVKKLTSEARTAFGNSNFGVNIITSPKNLVKIDGSFATSFFQSLNTAIQNISYPGHSTFSSFDNYKARSAYIILAEREIAKGLTLEASDQFVAPGFKNLGNPFMRTNFREQKIKSKLALFHDQLAITAFYKTMRDNPLKLSEITNKTSGYGLALQTKFKNKNLPNFNASVSPYEQGNNHPDSLFRINSKFSIITTGLTWRMSKGRFKYFLMIYGSQSQMRFSDTFTAKVQTLSINQDIAIGKHITTGMGTNFIRTFPEVDSTQANIWQVRMAYISKKGSNIMLSSQYSQYLNGAFRKGAALSASIPVGKRYKLTAKCSYDHYYKLWGMQNQEAWSGLVRLEIRI